MNDASFKYGKVDRLADDDILPISRHTPNHRQELKNGPRVGCQDFFLITSQFSWMLG